MITGPLFAETVADSFAFLVWRCGYVQEPNSCDYFVRYRRLAQFVDVIYDATRSHELGVLVGRLGESTPPFELVEVLRGSGCPELEVKAFDLIQTTQASVLKRALSKASALLERYGSEVLQGYQGSFEKLLRSRSRSAAAYMSAIIRSQVATIAESAWQSKNYGEYVRILAPHRDQLDATMLRRLQYAEKRQ